MPPRAKSRPKSLLLFRAKAGKKATSAFRSPKAAFREFNECASLFSAEIFVEIAAYIDESGQHDPTGKETSSKQVVVAGWVDWRDNWAPFCDRWKSALDKYDARYFHFQEWAYASKI